MRTFLDLFDSLPRKTASQSLAGCSWQAPLQGVSLAGGSTGSRVSGTSAFPRADAILRVVLYPGKMAAVGNVGEELIAGTWWLSL